MFDFDGETKYVQEKETARGIIVKHLGKAVPLTEFFTEEVFTDEFLLKEISPGCSLEGLMLKLKLQYFGHLM